eukprot:TRINITY_DN11188_c0_g1_i1.p1 TRINITY_DN11188_c0_g1~~TRINITY_DN11188_c0_g1_i1.p1  ORF type:complete len:387 (-),score=44.78 TRINITY_DN11188_c0_g1_i1:22-1182(-)
MSYKKASTNVEANIEPLVETLVSDNVTKKRSLLWSLFLVLGNVITGVGLVVTFVNSAEKMNGIKYVPFLLYSTTIVCTFVFLIIALIWARDQMKLHLWKWYLFMGSLQGFGAIFYQYGDPFVSGILQSLLSSVVLPATYFGVRMFLRDQTFNLAMNAGCFIVVGGIILGVSPPFFETDRTDGKSTVAGVILYILGVIFSGACLDIVQQKIFSEPYNCNIWAQAFIINGITIIPSFLTIFLNMLPPFGGESFSQILQNQKDSFLCFTQTKPLPENCYPGAPWWVICFVFFFVSNFLFQSALIKDESAVFQCIAFALVTPVASLSFAIQFFGGERVTWYVIVSLVVVFFGAILYRYGSWLIERKESDDLVPLENHYINDTSETVWESS